VISIFLSLGESGFKKSDYKNRHHFLTSRKVISDVFVFGGLQRAEYWWPSRRYCPLENLVEDLFWGRDFGQNKFRICQPFVERCGVLREFCEGNVSTWGKSKAYKAILQQPVSNNKQSLWTKHETHLREYWNINMFLLSNFMSINQSKQLSFIIYKYTLVHLKLR